MTWSSLNDRNVTKFNVKSEIYKKAIIILKIIYELQKYIFKVQYILLLQKRISSYM